MHRNDLKRAVGAALALTTLGALHPGMAMADQRIVCPVAAVQLDTAAPILGPLQGPDPWGELHGESVKKNDGTFVNKFDLAGGVGGVAPQLEKWLICYYQDGSHQAIKLATSTKECDVWSKRDGVDPTTKKPRYRVFDITCK
jgi:hypothetical protein